MSSSNHQELFLLTKDDKEDLSNFEIVMKRQQHTLEEFQSESNETLSSSSNNSKYSQKEEIEECSKIGSRITKADSESSTSKLKDEDEDEEDGFKTPTSLDHKIPVPSQCPLAPRKTIKPSLKRKASSNNYNNYCRQPQPLDLSKEVLELLFQTQQLTNPLSASSQQQRTKKVRREQQQQYK